MSSKPIRIETILGGQAPSEFFASKGQFQSSIGIEPDFPKDDSSIKTSGLLRPTAMEKFSSTEITGVPLWFVTNPKTTNTYLYANDGKVHTIASNLTMGTALNGGSALSTSSGNGADYYDNYAYFIKNTDVARYGPLNGSPSLTQDYWTNALAKTALVDTTYPSIRGVEIPNHPTHRHTDNKLYIGDVVGNQGVLHFIKTTKSSVEGDTNDGSTYNALDFPFGYYPTSIETYGNDLAVALIEGVDTTIKQKRAKISFWDTTSDSYQRITDVEFPDPLITAIKNINGILYVWSGNASGGVRISRFVGGYTYEEVFYNEEGVPPFDGAVDHEMNKILWGGYVTDPEAAAVVFGLGSKKRALGNGLFTPFKATSAGANQNVTAVKFLEQANNSRLRPIIGWSDDSAKGLDKISTTYGVSVWRSEVFRVGAPFTIKKIRIPLAQAVAANMTITPKIYIDDASSSETLTVINNTNYTASERNIVLQGNGIDGKHNFFLELRWSGTVLLTVGLPITIEMDIEAD